MKKLMALGAAVALAVTGVIAVSAAGRQSSTSARPLAATCSAGYSPLVRELSGDASLWLHAHPSALRKYAGLCINNEHPELYGEVAALAAQRDAMLSGGRPGSYAAAVRQASAIAAKGPTAAGAAGVWQPYGKGPLVAADPRFDSVNGEGLDQLSGRVDSLEYDPASGRLFATIGTGGVWTSTDLGKTWKSIGDKLPTQINGAVGWSKAGGGTVILVSGEPLNGGDTYTGMGAFWSNDLGAHWHRAKGVPNGSLGYQVAVSPKNAKIVYVATSQGLYRSVDAGRSFVNTDLPTGECAGVTGFGRCEFANFVTDVVVKTQGGTKHASGGGVLAVVGYRAGQKTFPDGKQESPMNGVYRSKYGKPGTFKKLAADGFAPQERIGRTELGVATGPDQNHQFVYAVVEDARLFNEGQTAQIDAPEDLGTGVGNTVFNGIYVSQDFGKTWTQMADTQEISDNPNTESALVGTGQATLYAPGVQSWYNEWIKVDPTRQTADGIPTRILFGLEEIWVNRNTDQPQDGSTNDSNGDFHVIGPYFAGNTCLLEDTGQPNCPTRATTDRTTHPDQHDATFVPDATGGGVTLLVGNDGGVFQQHAAKDAEFAADKWGNGTNKGFHTLLPYDADMANDGRTWFGLQDNGSGYIDPTTQKQVMTFGGDGFWVATDPEHSDTAYSEVTGANMRVTTDGGQTWRDMGPIDAATANSNSFLFANPFVMDPTDAAHLMTAGTQVLESTSGPDTQQMDPSDDICLSNCWTDVFDLPGGSMSMLDLQGDAAYVGFCNPCDLLNHWDPGFANGLATNVGGDAPPKRMTSDGWHLAKAEGLPSRYISGVAIDPSDPNIVYVTLAGYANRQWVPPGSYLDPNKNIGTGNVYRSTDAGEHFTNISGNLPNAPAFSVEIHGSQIVVGTQVGAFISKNANGGTWSVLGTGLPHMPVNMLTWKGGDPSSDLLVAATFGRGVYTYRFS